MVEILREAYAKKHRRRGRTPKLSIEDLLLVNLKDGQIVCLAFANGKKHDFRLFKESHTHVLPGTLVEADTGYLGFTDLHSNSSLPKKRSKKHPLTKQERRETERLVDSAFLGTPSASLKDFVSCLGVTATAEIALLSAFP